MAHDDDWEVEDVGDYNRNEGSGCRVVVRKQGYSHWGEGG